MSAHYTFAFPQVVPFQDRLRASVFSLEKKRLQRDFLVAFRTSRGQKKYGDRFWAGSVVTERFILERRKK